MTAVTIANAVLARRQDSELLGLYALAGGLATPGLLSMGHGNEIFLFSYLALLNAGALFLLASHQWKRVAWAALLGTAVYYIGWSLSEDDPSRLPLTVFFLALFFAGFAAAPFLDFARSHVVAAGLFFPHRVSDRQCRRDVDCADGAFRRQGQHAGRPWVTIALAGACLLMAAARRRPAVLSPPIWSGHLFCDRGRAAGI